MPRAVYNLANNIDVQQTEARVAEYARANRASIIAAQAKQVRPVPCCWTSGPLLHGPMAWLPPSSSHVGAGR